MTEVNLKGGCLCGAVQYELGGEATRFYHCHCSRCRKVSGTGHSTNLFVKLSSLAWTQGEELIGKFKAPDAKYFATWFCTQCGSPVPRHIPQANVAVIPAGSLDSDVPIKPQARVYWGSRTEWTCEPGDLPVFDDYPK